MKSLIFLIYLFQSIVNINCQQYVPTGRYLHTATLVGTKIYFLGGALNAEATQFTNDLFYLDISKSFDKTKGALPFVDLSDKSSEIPKHYAATTAVFGELKDSIFFFGGNMSSLNSPQTSMYSFNTTTQSEWKIAIVSQGFVPTRRAWMDAVTDNNNKIYIYGGATLDISQNVTHSNDMIIFDTINKIWINGTNGPFIRVGYTATFLPDANEIIYIGGYTQGTILTDIANLDVYDTINSVWNKRATKNSPEPRAYHTSVLTYDKRIIVFGGVETNISLPVRDYYVVLDVKTSEWYHGKGDISTKAPFRGHTASLYDNYMFIAFGQSISIDNSPNNDILIYKIEDYANFTEVNSFIPITDINDFKLSNKRGAIIGTILGSELCIIILGFTVGFIITKKCKPVIRVA